MTVSPPLVSAIVPVFNGAKYLHLALDSIRNQTLQSVEAIVVNDGSTDGSGEIARQYATRDPRRFVHVEQENAGLPSARNAAIRVARGRYIALLDCDDVWLPNHLATLVQVLENDRSVAMAHANISFVGPDGSVLSTPRGRWTGQAERNAFRAIFLRQEHVSCPTAVCRRDLVVDLGGFDAVSAIFGCEDRDLWLRVCSQHAIRYVPEVTALYRVHPEGMSRNLERMRASRLILVEKHSKAAPGKQLRRAALAAIDVETGMTHLERGSHFRAVPFFARALLRAPFSISGWAAVARSFWPRYASLG